MDVTVKNDSFKREAGAVPSEVFAGLLPHSTDADFNRATARTTVLAIAQTKRENLLR